MGIQPKGEDLRKAVKWVSDERKFDPKIELKVLIEKACMKFDLSPMDTDFLLRTLLKEE